MLRMTDSMSDGMCGYVEWSDGERKVRVRWSIDGPITSQGAANEEAKRRLKGTHEIPAAHIKDMAKRLLTESEG